MNDVELPELGKVTLGAMQELRDLGLLSQSGDQQLRAQIEIYMDEDKLRRLISVIYANPPTESIRELDLRQVGRDLRRFLIGALGG